MKVVVAMSGGVDSSVAAALMVEEGHEVVGVTLKQWEDVDGNLPTAGCCTVGDAEDARRVSAQLDIPYYVLDYVDEFRAAVVEPFGMSYLAGRTPNPCVECNRTVRFNALLERTADLGADMLATGHYARIGQDGDGYHLRKGVDPGKDQSYVLHMLTQAQLAQIQLPVGELTKPAVREHAARLGLRTAGKPDSQEICFVGDGNYRDFLADHFPETARPGPIVDMAGAVVGTHPGTAGFTIGQRRGLGVALQEPKYVVDIDSETSTIVIGDRHDLLAAGCVVDDVSFVSGRLPAGGAVEVKVRYRSRPVPARLSPDGDQWLVVFDDPQPAVAPGQAAVFYRGDEVLGGGTIERSIQ
ncbi:MAG: tRNA 2-thiouridine(34) synthase MnmA [Acidimicrobiia bacterium]|nr:tRNA 2-thiouridine(34) synthase MnmA [Acidimicrobiia bacterium]MBT8192374.1 tRNA 2-thiouridine(34) synthase MnmA [Acidimicrobiia bacterium]MBT8248552.1 tRNA 2-thiouridine(34) synthase MnmA [Acidimicrobiia bacterium]NNF87271.1 tRNA 2-thiouridine(34) synthase MnmA [Acidimicrobiia bacterium]NNJ47659.1 tRNA 2-thiouridine(34) synthase MnmA [Acidimicrobiia bacterium]